MPFSEKTLDFLYENRLNDSREWFREHRAEYDRYVLEPMRELVCELEPAILEIDESIIVSPKVGGSISRIFRDIRFSRDKSIFREHMWCSFQRDKKVYEGMPGFFFDLSPTGFCYGCGYYVAGRESLDNIRELVKAKNPAWRAAQRAYEKQDLFVFEGEKYKRPKYPEGSKAQQDWIDRKNLDFSCYSDNFDILYSPSLGKIISDGYYMLKPIYDFIMKAESMRIKKQVIN